jgi:hypothetical protein
MCELKVRFDKVLKELLLEWKIKGNTCKFCFVAGIFVRSSLNIMQYDSAYIELLHSYRALCCRQAKLIVIAVIYTNG